MDGSTLITDQRNFIMLKMLWLIAFTTCFFDLVSGRHYAAWQYLVMLIFLLLPILLLKVKNFPRSGYFLSMLLICYLGVRFFWHPSLINLLTLYPGLLLVMVYQNPALILSAGITITLVSIGGVYLQADSMMAAVTGMQVYWLSIPGLILTGIMLVLNRFYTVAGRRAENHQQQWRNIQEGLGVSIWSYEINTGRLFLSRGAEELIGLPVDWLIKQPEHIRNLVHPYDSLRLFEAYKELLAGKNKILEHRLLLADGSTRWVQNLAIPFKNRTGETTRIDGLIIDISEQKNREEKIKHMAFHDQLTGLPNRTMFENYFSLTMAGERNREQKLALIFIDLDNFKQVNDAMGHDVGDMLLKEVGQRIKTVMRENDLLARLGGDEFIALLTSIAPETTTLVAERILDSLARSFTIAGHELRVSASIGISLYPEDGKDLETLIKSADEAMYTAKRKGKSGYYFYAG